MMISFSISARDWEKVMIRRTKQTTQQRRVTAVQCRMANTVKRSERSNAAKIPEQRKLTKSRQKNTVMKQKTKSSSQKNHDIA